MKTWLWVLRFWLQAVYRDLGGPQASSLIVSGDSQPELSGHLGSKFLQLKADGSQLNGEQKCPWLSGSILRESGCSDQGQEYRLRFQNLHHFCAGHCCYTSWASRGIHSGPGTEQDTKGWYLGAAGRGQPSYSSVRLERGPFSSKGGTSILACRLLVLLVIARLPKNGRNFDEKLTL